jgi:bacterioferritin-associated ferredoxin
MYVCLCNAVTSQLVTEAITNGHTTTKKVAAATCAGDTCGRCKATIRQLIAACQAGTVNDAPRPAARTGRWLAREQE